MLFSINTTDRSAQAVAAETLAALKMRERYDLQEWIIHTPEILGEPLLIITSEFDRFDRTSERLDLLAIDRRGKLVIVELKRSAVGTAAELQALRYAAYCSTLLLDDLVEMHQQFTQRRGGLDCSREDAARRIAEFVENPSFQSIDDKPRVILAAEEFPPEITATVLWLRSFDVDITCVRLRTYVVSEQLVLDSSVLIPLPESKDFLIRRERKEIDQALRTREIPPDAEAFIIKVPEPIRPIFRAIRAWLISQPNVHEGVFSTLLSYRRAPDRQWITWLQFTKGDVRISFPPELSIEPERIIRTSSSGWPIIGAKTADDVAFVTGLLGQTMELIGSGHSPVLPGRG